MAKQSNDAHAVSPDDSRLFSFLIHDDDESLNQIGPDCGGIHNKLTLCLSLLSLTQRRKGRRIIIIIFRHGRVDAARAPSIGPQTTLNGPALYIIVMIIIIIPAMRSVALEWVGRRKEAANGAIFFRFLFCRFLEEPRRSRLGMLSLLPALLLKYSVSHRVL